MDWKHFGKCCILHWTCRFSLSLFLKQYSVTTVYLVLGIKSNLEMRDLNVLKFSVFWGWDRFWNQWSAVTEGGGCHVSRGDGPLWRPASCGSAGSWFPLGALHALSGSWGWLCHMFGRPSGALARTSAWPSLGCWSIWGVDPWVGEISFSLLCFWSR